MSGTWTHERTEVIRTTITHVAARFLKNNEQFRRIRKRDKACKLCLKHFKEGQYLHLAFTNKGNKLICEECKEKAKASGVDCPNFQERREKNE